MFRVRFIPGWRDFTLHFARATFNRIFWQTQERVPSLLHPPAPPPPLHPSAPVGYGKLKLVLSYKNECKVKANHSL